MCDGRRRRRTKVGSKGKIRVKKGETVPLKSNPDGSDDPLTFSEAQKVDGGSEEFVRSNIDTTAITPLNPSYESKLAPLSGTARDAQRKYQEKNIIQRNFEELTAPTAAGEEPKAIKLAKTVTWGAVIVLVLIEIVVSLKVGGAPFKFGKVELPDIGRMLNIK